MKRLIKYIVSIGAVALLLIAVASLNVAIQRHNETTSKTSTATATRLNVAVVNEDKAVTSGNRLYSLGNSYIKKLEKDDSQNWSVVTRGTADSGNYQLVVIIPSDFSAKILDLNSLNAKPATISYEVKADGNQQIETEATKVGKDIVSDLNNQLVDMYMASILSNLYTAQQNVQVIANQQSGNIYAYQTNLLASALNFETNFPNLVTAANGSLTANESLIQSLSRFSTLYHTLDSSQQSFRTDLMALVEKRANDSISYGEFANALLSLDGEALATDLTTMTGVLQGAQEQLEVAVVNVSGARSNEATGEIQQQVDSLTTQIETLQGQLAEQKKVLDTQKSTIKQFAEEEVARYYTADKTLTVADLLKQKRLDENGQSLSYLPTSFEDYQKAMQAITTSALNQLPTIQSADFASLSANMSVLDTDAGRDLAHFDVTLAERFAHSVSYTPSSLASELHQAKVALETAKANFEAEEKAYIDSLKKDSLAPGKVTAKVSLQLPTHGDFVLDSWSYNGVDYTHRGTQNVEVVLANEDSVDNQFQFTYHYDVAAATSDFSISDRISVVVNGVTVASASTTPDMTSYQEKAKEYRAAESAYTAKVQEVQDVYHHAQDLLKQYYLTTDFLDQSVVGLMTDLLATAIMNNLTAYTENSSSTTEALDQQIKHLEEKRDEIANQLVTLRTTNSDLAVDLARQIDAVQALQTKFADLKTQESAVSSALSSSDSTLSSLSSTLSDLLSSTSELKGTSESNATEANQVNTLFSSFDTDVKTAQANSSKLATDAQDLMGQFNQELEESGDFVGSFVKVLNNAYSNGVANEALLDFLSNPVIESSSSIKATVNAYRPFTWILLVEIVSLFNAYIFATYNVIQKVQDKFRINKLEDTDFLNTAVISLIALVSGITLGVISSSQLSVERELIPSWVLLFTLFSLLLTQGQYLLLKNIKAVGMGLSLFMTISFVYLSSAIGTTATLTGLPAALKSINLLSILESNLSSYFDGQAASLGVLLASLLTVLVLIGVNVFWTVNWQKILQNTSKTEV